MVKIQQVLAATLARMKLAVWLVAAGLCMGAGPVEAVSARLIIESNLDLPGGEEWFQVSYASFAGLKANDASSTGFLPQDLAPDYSLADIADDPRGYQVLLQANPGSRVGSPLFLLSYASWDDLQRHQPSAMQWLKQDVSLNYAVHGFAYDGTAYHLLLESNADRPGGEELYLVSYASFADLLADKSSGEQFLPLDINPSYSVAGLAFDQGSYRLLLESNVDAGAGDELFLISYASFADFLNHQPSDIAFLDLDVSPYYSVHGFEFETSAVPEPGSAVLMLAGMALVGAVVRRRWLWQGAVGLANGDGCR